MRIEIVILGITAFFIYDTYNDGKYMKILKSGKKYYQMAFYGVLGLGIYLMIKRNPAQSKNMLHCANNMVKYLPVDKSSLSMLNPIMDFTVGGNDGYGEDGMQRTHTGSFMSMFNNANGLSEQRILSSGQVGAGQGTSQGTSQRTGKATKRSVSETKKKYIASQQDWKCGDCKCKLNAWFEVDHIKRLEHGGGNEVENLVALCRDCHGKKTAMENM